MSTTAIKADKKAYQLRPNPSLALAVFPFTFVKTAFSQLQQLQTVNHSCIQFILLLILDIRHLIS